jgi:hypothetical protein
MSAIENLAKELSLLENNSKIITDKTNEIMAMNIPAGEQFWNFAKMLVDEQIMRSFLVPQMVWSEGSGALGVGSLSNTQLSVMDSSIEAVVRRIQDKIIQNIVKPLIIWNFGAQENYGEFKFSPKPDAQSEMLITQNLMSALSSGLISGASDLEAINELRKRLSLSVLTQDDLIHQALLAQEIQKATSQASGGEQA